MPNGTKTAAATAPEVAAAAATTMRPLPRPRRLVGSAPGDRVW